MSIKKTEESNQDISNEMEKALDSVKDPAFKEMLTNVWKNVKNSDIYKEAEEIKNKIIKTPNRPEQLIFSFLPHELAKVSIFFPMSDKELKEEKRIIQKIEQESSWGKIVIEGIKLAIFEEDVFLALMNIVKNKIKSINEQYLLETNVKDVDNLLYGRSGYTKRTTNLILRSLDHFGLVSFKLTLYKDQKKKGPEIFISGIIQRYDYDPNTQNLKIYFNPHFFSFFLESMLTNINFTLRRKLKKDGSKAILRFLTAHNHPNRMHILTVLNAINFNTNQPTFRLRSRLKDFIKELKKNEILGPKTKLYNDDTVYFDVLPFKKTLPE